jgi:hypothetical protein
MDGLVLDIYVHHFELRASTHPPFILPLSPFYNKKIDFY